MAWPKCVCCNRPAVRLVRGVPVCRLHAVTVQRDGRCPALRLPWDVERAGEPAPDQARRARGQVETR